MAVSSIAGAAAASYQAAIKPPEPQQQPPMQLDNERNQMNIRPFEANANEDRRRDDRPPPERVNLPPGVGTKINQIA